MKGLINSILSLSLFVSIGDLVVKYSSLCDLKLVTIIKLRKSRVKSKSVDFEYFAT